VAADRLFHVFRRWVRQTLQQSRAAHCHTWRAEATLQGVMLDESFLHRMKLIATSKALDRRPAIRNMNEC